MSLSSKNRINRQAFIDLIAVDACDDVMAFNEYSIDFNKNDISAFKLLCAFDSINKAGFKICLNYDRNRKIYEKIFGNLEELAIKIELEK